MSVALKPNIAMKGARAGWLRDQPHALLVCSSFDATYGLDGIAEDAEP